MATILKTTLTPHITPLPTTKLQNESALQIKHFIETPSGLTSIPVGEGDWFSVSEPEEGPLLPLISPARPKMLVPEACKYKSNFTNINPHGNL
jgi:hypothetical protein